MPWSTLTTQKRLQRRTPLRSKSFWNPTRKPLPAGAKSLDRRSTFQNRAPLRKHSKSSYIRKRRLAKRYFSLYIRNRDGWKCFTCPWQADPNKASDRYLTHAGHFIHKWNATYFDERNVHSQCERCNVGLDGNLDVYRERMIAKYGLPFVETLEFRAQKATLPVREVSRRNYREISWRRWRCLKTMSDELLRELKDAGFPKDGFEYLEPIRITVRDGLTVGDRGGWRGVPDLSELIKECGRSSPGWVDTGTSSLPPARQAEPGTSLPPGTSRRPRRPSRGYGSRLAENDEAHS